MPGSRLEATGYPEGAAGPEAPPLRGTERGPGGEVRHRPRGGRRPGAGAPLGNTNALTLGAYSRRYGYAVRLIAALPALNRYLNELINTPGPRALERRRRFLDATRHVIETRPRFAAELEAIIYRDLTRRDAAKLPRGEAVLRLLGRAPDHTRPLKRAITLTAWCAWHDERLERLLTNHVLQDLEPAMDVLARNSTKRSEDAPETPKPAFPESQATR
jgi:hypothetical protein